jgi:hypothetical protein
MRLTGTKKPNIWDKEINITLTIRELQMIRDCIAKSSYFNVTNNYNTTFNREPPYKDCNLDDLYNQVQEILESQGGYTV